MNGRSLDEVGDRYRYQISVKTLTKTSRRCCKNSYEFIARAILRYFSARLSCTHAQFAHEGGRKKIANRLFDPNLLEN